jgi:hypothetical protein
MISSILHSKSAIHQLPPHLEQAAIDAYAHSLSAVWFTAAGVAILTILASLFIQEKDIGGGKGEASVAVSREDGNGQEAGRR